MIAIYPGSFDPITLGHLDVITRASKLFNKIIIGVVGNPAKKPMFSVSQRVQFAEETVTDLHNVTISTFDGLTVDFAKQHQATVIVRGLRAISDFEFEFQMSQMNKTLYPELETVFVMAKLDYTFLSSSMVKELLMLGGDISTLVPIPVQKALTTMGQQ